MDQFIAFLREEFEKELSIGGNYASKERLMQAFDKACVRALYKYAKSKGIDLT